MHGPFPAWRFAIGQRQVTLTDRSKQSVISMSQSVHIAESARETPMTGWPQSAHRSPGYVSRLRQSDA
jgi:hypothetical protein